MPVSWPSPEIVSWSRPGLQAFSRVGRAFLGFSRISSAGVTVVMKPSAPTDTNHPLITVEELATLLRTTVQGIRSRQYRGQIPDSAILKTSPRGRVLYRRHVIERHFGLVPRGAK